MENDMQNIREALNGRLTQELAEIVKAAALNGKWRETEKTFESDDPAEIAEAAMEAATRTVAGGLPVWFLLAVSAADTILRCDEAAGLECIAALYESTLRGSTEQRLAAVEKLLSAAKGSAPAALGIGLGGLFG